MPTSSAAEAAGQGQETTGEPDLPVAKPASLCAA
jgi:hypothetical protein